MTASRVMWNRWIANPREHYCSDDQYFPQPICGQPLSVPRANFANKPTGLAPMCPRCVSKLARARLREARHDHG